MSRRGRPYPVVWSDVVCCRSPCQCGCELATMSRRSSRLGASLRGMGHSSHNDRNGTVHSRGRGHGRSASPSVSSATVARTERPLSPVLSGHFDRRLVWRLRAGMSSHGLSTLASMYFYLPPAGFGVNGVADILSLTLFVATGLAIAWLNHRLRQAEHAHRVRGRPGHQPRRASRRGHQHDGRRHHRHQRPWTRRGVQSRSRTPVRLPVL